MNLYKDKKWCVYLNGTDECLATKDFEGAVDCSNQINRNLISAQVNVNVDGYEPALFAQVELWDVVADGEHNPNEVDWSQFGVDYE